MNSYWDWASPSAWLLVKYGEHSARDCEIKARRMSSVPGIHKDR